MPHWLIHGISWKQVFVKNQGTFPNKVGLGKIKKEIAMKSMYYYQCYPNKGKRGILCLSIILEKEKDNRA